MSRLSGGSSAYSGWIGQTWWFSAIWPRPWKDFSSSSAWSMQATTAWRSLRLSKGASVTRNRMTAVCAVVVEWMSTKGSAATASWASLGRR